MSRSVRLTAQANSIATKISSSADDLQKAEILLQTAEQANPHGTTWLQIGRAYMELEDFASSRRAFEQARQKLSDNPALELFSAVLCMDENDTEQAQKHLDELRRICPDNQALPTAQALCLLLRGRVSPALDIIHPDKKEPEKYEIAVSPLLISRLAAAVEKILLPRELPDKDILNTAVGASRGGEHAELPKGHDEQTADGAANSQESADSPDTAAELRNDPDDSSDNIPASAGRPSVPAVKGIADPQAFAEELKPYLPKLPPDTKIGGFHLRGSGTERLQRSWNLPDAERSAQFKLAVHELFQAYCASPKAYQSAFSLAEGLLALAEYDRDRTRPYDASSLTFVQFAERLLQEALIRDKDTAFANHYLARAALLQHRYDEAVSFWKSALDLFAKLPEAYYGLGQAMLMLEKPRLGRLYIAHAVNSDMHLLRERLADLACVAGSRSDSNP